MGPRNGLFGGDRGSYGKGTFILKSEHEKLLTLHGNTRGRPTCRMPLLPDLFGPSDLQDNPIMDIKDKIIYYVE